MKDQDYKKIMDRISEEHIEEAVSWDASAQQNRRSIRRMSLGIGAIAASIAVIVGSIGYSVYRGRPDAIPGAEVSAAPGASLNLLGGHGELKAFFGNDDSVLYRDDDNYYLSDGYHSEDETAEGGPSPDTCYFRRWAVNGSTSVERIRYDGRLLSDGERLYTYHDNQLYITDSFGNETEFLASPWKPFRIRKLNDDWYLLSAFVEDAWIGDAAKPYVLMYAGGEGKQINQFFDYGDVRTDGDALYYLKKGTGDGDRFYTASFDSILDAQEIAEFPDEQICEWTLKDDLIYWFKESADSEMFMGCTEKKPGGSTERDAIMYADGDDGEWWLRQHLLKDKMYVFGADFGENYASLLRYDLTEQMMDPDLMQSDPDPTMFGRVELFHTAADSLWDGDLSDDMAEFTVYDTGDEIIFTLPIDGKHGEQIVQINTETHEYRYAGENYAPEQPKDDTQPEDTPAPETVPQQDSGFCSPETFSIYYIPQEHMDSDKIACYRMLPAAKASASQFNADVLGDSLPEGGGFVPNPNENPHISIDEAKDIILNSDDPLDTSAIYVKIHEASKMYAGKYPYESIGRVCYEYWLADDGSEFIVAMCGYAGEQETIEFVYFRYDTEAKQFAYQYIPARTNSNTSADANTETNVLGGKGVLRPFITEKDNQFLAEDDEYIYDLSYSLRASKTGEDTVYKHFTPAAIPQYDPEQKNLIVVDGMVILVGGNTLYEVGTDGTMSALLSLAEDEKGNQLANLSLHGIKSFAKDTSGRPTKLFLRGYADRPADANGFGYNIKGILDLTTGKFSNLDGYGDYARYIVAEDAVFCIGHMTEKPLDKLDEKLHIELIKYTTDNNGIVTDVSDWDIENIAAIVYQGSETFMFRDINNKLCTAKFGDKTAVDTGKDAPFTTETTVNRIAGTNKIVYSLNNPARLILSDMDNSNPEVLKEGAANRDYGYDVFGTYSENGVIHIYYIGDNDRPTVLIKDGSSVTSYCVDIPQ